MAGAVGITGVRARHLLAVGAMLAGILLAGRPCVFALGPTLDVSQYAHTAWKVRDGFAKGFIDSIAQTPDGYLWLGTEFGLYRFDGLRLMAWQPPAGQQLPDNTVCSLLVTHDGTLWIGTAKGLASWKDGKLKTYPEVSGEGISAVFQDREGTVWVGSLQLPSAGKLCTVAGDQLRCQGGDGTFGPGITGMYEDSKGNLWFGEVGGFWKWKPGPSEYFAMPGDAGITSFAENDNGALLLATSKGLQRFIGGRVEAYPLPGFSQPFRALRMLRDRDGGLWVGTGDQGLMHLHGGNVDGFSQADGLSGGGVGGVFEDREGNIWTATENGIDRFRDYAIPNVSVRQGLLNSTTWSALPAKDGVVWIGTTAGLNKWKDGGVSVFGAQSGTTQSDGKLNGSPPESLFQDSTGRIWISTRLEFGYLENDRFIPIHDLPSGYVHDIVEVISGHLWVANQQAGLFHLFEGKIVQQIPWAGLGHNDFVWSMTADPSQHGLWLGFYRGGVAYFADGGIQKSYSSADGLGEGAVSGLRFGPRGALWAATQGGLSRIKDGRAATLTSKNGLPCNTVHWRVEDDEHNMWLYMACGLVRIARSDMDAWVADPAKVVRTTVFDVSDGVPSHMNAAAFVPRVAKSSDGKIWFVAFDGVSVIDPHHLAFNKVPPPVHVEQVIADRKMYEAAPDSGGRVRLPPRVRDLQIDYTALSLVAPEKVLFRYKLEGWDRDWQEAGTRRQAFYSNLPPRKYTFRVKACNNSGVWNEAGTSLNFFVAPAYYQTWWFRSLCVTAVLGFLYAFYQLRLRQLAQQFNMRLEGRVAERTRIARDLHDTLLQSVQGLLLKLHAVTYRLPDRGAEEARKMLEDVIEQARQAVTESRDTVQGLRSSTLPSNEIAKAFGMFADELAADHADQNRPELCVQVRGTPRDLAPILRDEIYRIGCEALRNAFRHAFAARIGVEIHYDPRRFRLRVRDNGKGIAPEILKAGRAGHYGLASMHERAKGVGGKMAVWSEVGSGTEVELTIPASIAYAKSAVAHEKTFSKKRA